MRAHAQAVVGEERHHRVRRGITVAYLCSWHRRARVLLATSVSSLLPERGEGVVDGGRAGPGWAGGSGMATGAHARANSPR